MGLSVPGVSVLFESRLDLRPAHDTAYIRLPDGAEYILAVFTVDNSKQTEIIPFVSQPIAQAFAKTAPKADLEPVDAKPELVNGVIETIIFVKRASPTSI